jgi:hypothetical protein
MKKTLFVMRSALLLTLVIMLSTQVMVFADISQPVDVDLSVSSVGGDNDPGSPANPNIVRSTSTQGVSGGCNPVIAGAYSVAVSSLASSVPAKAATLSMRVANLSAGNKYPLTLELFAATADISESPVTATSLAALRGASLGSQVVLAVAPAIGSTISFPSSTNFVDQFDAAARVGGDGRLTVLVQITGCPGTGAYTVDLASHESGNPAQLGVSAPTAVTMSTFRATDPALNWPLIAGLGALFAVVVGGLAVARKRAAPH